MTKPFTFSLYILFISFLIPVMSYAQPVIHSLTPESTSVEKYTKFEVALDLTASYTNEYDYDEIAVKGVFTAPDNRVFNVDGFFKEDLIVNSNGSLTPNGNGFKVRFSPDMNGVWTYQISLTDNSGTDTYASQSFTCIAQSSSKNNGFVRTGSSHYLEFDNGDQYIPVGENMAWQNGNAFVDYKKWVDKLAANDGNFFRLWHAHWGLGIEWKSGWNSFQGLRKYKEVNGTYQDWLFDYCADNGVYIMLCLQHHGQVSTQVNPNWSDSPYNTANGGPCANTAAFFTNSEAKAHTKNRFRYVVARWGYARSIMSWELFNEVEWTDNFSQNRTAISNWHDEMAAYLKQIDPYQHLVTTSYAHDDNDPLVWTGPDVDLTQTHYYINTPHIERALASGNRTYLDDFDKPTLNGEFGLGGSSTISQDDPDGIHIHNALWASLMSGAMGAAMTWWWDNYIHPQDLYHHFSPVSMVAEQIPFRDKKFAPADAFTQGAAGDLVLTPTVSWGVVTSDSFNISSNGIVTPGNATLSAYLYGSSWNTQYRSPPTFHVDFPKNGVFTVTTGNDTGTDPKINIYVDGSQVLNSAAQPNKTYTVNISAGQHSIKVDNTGTDWISIASYTFSGAGSAADVYAVKSEDKTVAAGWVLSSAYNHENVVANGTPDPVDSIKVTIQDFKDGAYFVKLYDCLTGALIATEPVTATNDELTFDIPELYWDLAFKVDDEFVAVGIEDELKNQTFSVYPNPAKAGLMLTIKTSENIISNAKITLLDMGGRIIGNYSSGNSQIIGEEIRLNLPTNLSKGLYWLKLENGQKVGTRAVVVE